MNLTFHFIAFETIIDIVAFLMFLVVNGDPNLVNENTSESI